MSSPEDYDLRGHCGCGKVRYALTTKPMVVHCCHCTYCQRESGAAFAVNAMIETSRVVCSGLAPIRVTVPSASGRGQVFARCPECFVTVWSNYGSNGDFVRFVRGTLEQPELCKPDIHIFTASKQAWVNLEHAGVPVMSEYYKADEVWTAESLKRRSDLKEYMQRSKEGT